MIVQTTVFTTPEQVRAESSRGYAIHERDPVEISFRCLDQYCLNKNILFACKKRKAGGNNIESTAYSGPPGSSSPWIGMRVENLPAGPGAVIARIDAEGPAKQAGLKVGDVIETFNGATVQNSTTIADISRTLSIGFRVPIALLRDGKHLSLSLTVRTRGATL